jgi:hypothetical protein
MPMATPAIAVSASGVSITRSGPKRACNPTVARNTPPFTPISSPRSTTSGSCSLAWTRAILTACTRLISAMAASAVGRETLGLSALLQEGFRQRRVEMIEHVLDRGRWHLEEVLYRSSDFVGAFPGQPLLLLLESSSRQLSCLPRRFPASRHLTACRGGLLFDLTFGVNFLPEAKVLHESGYSLLAQTLPRLGLFRGHPEKVLAWFGKYMN